MSTASPAARKVVRKTRTEESASTYRPRLSARDGYRGSLLDGSCGNEDHQVLVLPGVAGKQPVRRVLTRRIVHTAFDQEAGGVR